MTAQNKAMLPRAVIFDWDNTLIDSWGAIGEAMNHTRKSFGQSAWTRQEVITNCVRSARDSFPEWFGDRWQEATDIFYVRFSEVQMQSLAPLPGAEAMLRWLKGKHVPAYVVSNKNGEYLRREVKALQWGDLFVAVAGATDAPRDKPARDHVDFVLKKGGTVADKAIWFAGDSATDMLCARNAGCTPVFIGALAEAEKLAVERAYADCTDLMKAFEELAAGKN